MTLRFRAKMGRNGTFSIPKGDQEKLGLHPGDFIEVSLDLPESENRPVNRRRISAMGKFAGLGSSEEFMRGKQEEIELEEERYQRWSKGFNKDS